MHSPYPLLSAILALLVGAAQAQEPLETTVAEYRTLPLTVQLEGVVEAVNRGTVSAQTQGRVAEVLFDVDDFVEQGTVIVRLDDATHQVALRQALARKAGAEARYAEALKEQRRIQGVFARKAASRAEMDRATAALRSMESDLAVANSEVDGAEEQLAFTQIRAPYSGIVTQRHIEVGETATPGRLIMSGVSLDRLRVRVDVSQRLVKQIRKHRKATLLIEDGGEVAATTITIFPFADPATKTFRVRLDLPEGIDGLMPGMYVKTSFAIGEEAYLLIPASAVVYRSEVTGAYVVDEQQQVHLRRLRVGETIGDSVVVRAGLEEGEQVFADPIRAGVLLKRESGASSDE